MVGLLSRTTGDRDPMLGTFASILPLAFGYHRFSFLATRWVVLVDFVGYHHFQYISNFVVSKRKSLFFLIDPFLARCWRTWAQRDGIILCRVVCPMPVGDALVD